MLELNFTKTIVCLTHKIITDIFKPLNGEHSDDNFKHFVTTISRVVSNSENIVCNMVELGIHLVHLVGNSIELEGHSAE